MSASTIPGRTRILAPLILSALVLALYWRTPVFLATCEQNVQDLLLNLAPTKRSDSSTCVILTGESSSPKTAKMDAQGIAKIITAVAQGKPRAIGICDCPADADAAFEAAVRGAGKTVVGYRLACDVKDSPRGSLGVVEKSRIQFSTNPWGRPRRWMPSPQAVLECANARAVDAAAGCGFSNIPPDADGVARGVPLVAWAEHAPYQGFPVALLAVSLGARRVTLRLKGEAVEGIDVDGLRVNTDSGGRLMFREYAGGMVCSAAALLEGKLPPPVFSGKIVLIGSSGRRLRTRTSPSVPEAVILATAAENALRDDYLRRSRGMGLLEIALIIGAPFAIAHLAGWRKMAATLGVPALVAVGAVILLMLFRQEMRVFYPGISALISWILPSGRRTRARSEKRPYPSSPL
ncbi:MAG: CHASE2 domain-containing protein [Candidatus Aureabacteria bacterium]|nr:CHASE2 domain-containing protein [Candidatus Auribacterota bacterium]